MKALTLWQPWAMLMALDQKRLETRSWQTAYRGKLAIHAAQKFPPEVRALIATEPFLGVLAKVIEAPDDLPFGAIVAVVDLVDIIPTKFVTSQSQGLLRNEIEFGDYSAGRFAWVTANVRRLPVPIPCPGKQGIWTVPRAIEREILQEKML